MAMTSFNEMPQIFLPTGVSREEVKQETKADLHDVGVTFNTYSFPTQKGTQVEFMSDEETIYANRPQRAGSANLLHLMAYKVNGKKDWLNIGQLVRTNEKGEGVDDFRKELIGIINAEDRVNAIFGRKFEVIGTVPVHDYEFDQATGRYKRDAQGNRVLSQRIRNIAVLKEITPTAEEAKPETKEQAPTDLSMS